MKSSETWMMPYDGVFDDASENPATDIEAVTKDGRWRLGFFCDSTTISVVPQP